MIGPLSTEERLNKVRKYLDKKRRVRARQIAIRYECRKRVAAKRLRIKGRFMTRAQALKVLGLSEVDLLENEQLQELLLTKCDG